VKYVPADTVAPSLKPLGEGHFPYLGSGPESAVRVTVAMNNGLNHGVLSTWNSLTKSLPPVGKGEIFFTVTKVVTVKADEKYEVYVKFFLQPLKT